MKKTVTSLMTALAVCVCMFAATASWAANGVWTGTVNALWTNSNNWSASPYPSGTDTASFTNNGNGQTAIDVASLSGIKTIMFDSPFVAAYTMGTGVTNSQTLIMGDSGEIKLTDTAANSQLFKCGLQLGTGRDGYTYTVNNLNTNNQTLTFNNVFGPAAGGTAGGKTLAINGKGNVSILGNIAQGGATSLTLTDNNSGILTLSGSNTVLTLNMNGGTNSIVDIGSGFLALNNGGGYTLTSTQGGTIKGTGKLWLSSGGVGNPGDNYVALGKTLTINTSIVSPGGFEIYGGAPPYGTFVLNATNTFELDVLYSVAGTISVWKIGNCASVDSNLGKGTNINFNAANAKLTYTGSGETSNRKLLINNSPVILDQSGTNGTLTFSDSPTLSAGAKTLTLQGSSRGIGAFSGALVNSSGTLSIFKDGSGTWLFTATNTYSGTTTVNGGTLLVNSPGSIASPVTVNTGALLGGNGTINGSVTLQTGGMLAPGGVSTFGKLSITNALALNGNTLFFDIDASNVITDRVAVAGALTLNGVNTVYLSFPRGVATVGTNTLMTFASKTGSGSFVLAPGYTNAFLLTDATSVSLVVTNTGTYGLAWKGNQSTAWDLGTANWTNGAAAVVYTEGDGVLFDDTASSFTVSGNNPVSPGSVVFNNNVNNFTVSTAIAGTASLMKLGSGITTLSGVNTYSGQTTINSGKLTIGGAGQLGNGNYSGDIVNGSELEYASSANQTHSGVILGIGALTLSGSGTLTLSGTNTYAGATTVNAGVLKIQNAAGLGTVAAGTTVAAGATLELAGNIITLAEALNLFGTLSSQTGSNTYAGVVTFQQGSSINVGAGSTNILSASTAGTGAFSKTGAGLLRLTADPNHSGVCTVSAGTLELTGSGYADADFIINAGATLRETTANLGDYRLTDNGVFDLMASDGIGGLDGSGLVTIGNTTANTFTVGGNNQAGLFSGVMENGSGALSFAKTGAGVQAISGVNTYTGTTTVAGGTLLINSPGSLANSAVTVNNGCTLGGSGTINGTVTMAAGSMMAPGGYNSIGTLTLGKGSTNSLTLNGNILRFDLSNGVGVSDNIAITGASGGLILNGLNFIALNFPNGPAPAGDYTLMTFQAYTGTGTFVLAKNYPNASLILNANNLVLRVAGGSAYYDGLTWKGGLSGTWDNGILNWTTNGTDSVAYTSGVGVTFDDTATGNFTVSSISPVSPANVLFDNSVNAYTVSAAMTGSGPLTKIGTSTATLSGASTYNPSSLSISAGTLALSGASQLNSGLYATNILNIGTFNYASSATQTLSGTISGSGAVTMSGSGALALTGNTNILGAVTGSGSGSLSLVGITNNLGSVTLNSGSMLFDGTNTVNGSVNVTGGAAGSLLTFNGTMSLPGAASDFTLAAAANDRSVMKQNAALTIGRNFNVGNANPSAGAGYQTNGITTVTSYLGVGVVAGGYGYYRLSGGTLNVRTYFEIGTSGSGVVDLFGGIISTDNTFDLARRSGGVGVLNVFGGTAKSPSNGNPIQMGRNDFAGPVGRLTVMGSGVVDATIGSTTKILDMNAGNGNGGTTVVNLLTGGTIIANKVSATRVGTTVFNFDGGILRASPLTTVGATFLTGLDSAIVYPGGAVIDTTNAIITITQNLKAPTDYGLSSISLSSTGAGYIGAPLVNITGGSGTGVTAIASVDLTDGSPTKGKLTGITMTSKGTGYKNTDVLTVTLSGGGFTAAAVTGACPFAVNSAAGGLTKLGSGTLTLSGTNTYGGATTISNGVLSLGIANALPTNSVVNVNGGVYNLGGFTVTNGAVNMTAGAIVNGRLNSAGFVKTAGGVVSFSVTQTDPAPIIINGGTLSLGGAAGLYEGRILNNAFDLISPNPLTAVRLCPTNAYLTFANSGASGGIWVDNTTYIYTGFIWNRAATNETWTFCKSFDDSVLIKVDSTQVINHTTWNVVATTNYVVTPGPHAFEVRLGQGGGGVGQQGTIPGIGFDRLGRSTAALCIPIIDPGDGSLLTLLNGKLADASTVQLATNALLDLGGVVQTLGGLSGSGTVSNGTLTVTGIISPAGTNVIGTLTAKANTTLNGRLLVDVATDGTSDRLDVLGNLTISSEMLEIQNLQGLSTIKVYTLVTCSGTISGLFTPTNLPDTRWTLRKTTDNKIQLYFKGGTMIRIM